MCRFPEFDPAELNNLLTCLYFLECCLKTLLKKHESIYFIKYGNKFATTLKIVQDNCQKLGKSHPLGDFFFKVD